MFRLVMSSIIIVLGIALTFVGIYDTPKKIVKKNIQDKNVVNNYLKHQKTIDVITGFSFIIVGILSILNLLTGEQVGIFCSIVYLLNRVITFKFSKKHQIIR